MLDETVLAGLTEGAQVIIEGYGERHRATVANKKPSGAFDVEWYSGQNRYAPHLPGHWYAEFEADGEPRQGWRIVEICQENEAPL